MLLPAAAIGLASPVDISATGTSLVINAQGQSKGAVGLASDHAGTLNVQRYVDAGGVIPLGAVITTAIVAGTPKAVSWTDGIPCGSIIVSFVNSSGAVANLTNITVNLQP